MCLSRIDVCLQPNSNYYDTLCTMLFNRFGYFIVCILTLLLHVSDDIAFIVFFFVKCLPEDGRKRSKHVG